MKSRLSIIDFFIFLSVFIFLIVFIPKTNKSKIKAVNKEKSLINKEENLDEKNIWLLSEKN